MLGGRSNLRLIEPVAYPEFVWLMDRSTLILTDSGGVQEEAPSLGKPALVMRDTTERPEAVEAGVAELVGADAERIAARASEILSNPGTSAAREVAINPYGDGRAAERIVNFILDRLGRQATTTAAMEAKWQGAK
jgi:UDP-N-acetylglucosamine 2-epimerase (non-hydrolysing)